MKINKQKTRSKSRRIIIVVSSLILVALLGVGVYLVGFKGSLFGWTPFATTTPADAPTQSSDDTNHGTKDDVDNSNDQTTDQIPVSETLVATITELSQSNGVVIFKGNANDTAAGGNCSIIFTNPNDRPVSRTVKANMSGGKAVCASVEIPETEFSFVGEWTATFRYYSNDTQAVAERKITIE